MPLGNYASTLKYYASGIYRELHNKDVFLWAQAIAFKILVTFIPLVVVGTGLIAQTIQPERPSALIDLIIKTFLPDYQSGELVEFLQQLQQASGTITLIGVISLTVTAKTLFATLRAVLANIFREEWHVHRSPIRAYIFDFRMAFQVGAFFVLSIVITLFVQGLNTSAIEMLSELGYEDTWFSDGLHGAFRWFAWLLPLLLSAVMFFQLIYFTPIPKPPTRSAWTGAIVAACLWEIAKVPFTMYVTRLASFQDTWMAAFGSTFVLILALVLWAYYSGLVLNVGSIATLLHERKHRYDTESAPALE
ncbi:MAG: YihY/virulence factor BrkB family protein [Bacteroidetes bacterium]|nr:MAG: YihY/virulence factor BrkB family protein [Bacteroidota bacterium]